MRNLSFGKTVDFTRECQREIALPTVNFAYLKGEKGESTFGHFLQYMSGRSLLSKKGQWFHLMVEMASCFIAACSLASVTASADSRR